MAESDYPSRLEELLKLADESKPDSIRAFYLELLRSNLLVPKSPLPLSTSSPAINSLGFFVAGTEDQPILPVFTSEKYLNDWIGTSSFFELIDFQRLGRILPPDFLLHLNPGADVGKEFNAWEISTLLKGEEAIEELIFELCEDLEQPSVEILDLPPEFASTIERWRGIFEAYESVASALVIAVRIGEHNLVLVGYFALGISVESAESLERELTEDKVIDLRIFRLDVSTADPLAEIVQQGDLIFERP